MRLAILILILITPALVFAQPPDFGNDVSGYTQDTERLKLKNPLGEGVTIPILIGKIIQAILGVTGTIALTVFIYGGYLMMFSGGNQRQFQKAKRVLAYAVLGLAVVFGSYAVIRYWFVVLGAQ